MVETFFDYREDNGLVSCRSIETARNNMELLYLVEARTLGIDAILFRRYFRDNEMSPYKSEPAVCIFNKSDSFFNTQEHLNLHASLWSSANHEIYIIKGQTRVDIINSRKPAEYDVSGKKLSIENLALVQNANLNDDFSKFSAYLFSSGTFWEQDDLKNQLDADKTPHILLLKYLLETRRSFRRSKQVKFDPVLVDKIIITCILIKFLEEREDDNGKHTLKSIYEKLGISDLSDAFSKRVFMTVIDELASEFNGKIFNKFNDDERKTINENELYPISTFLSGKVDAYTKQSFIWQQYDFKYLPAEVISAIYENFIQEDAVRETGSQEKGIVYTPIHLVNFLIDEVMPLDKPHLFADGNFKILDPSCGSGVFLVAAFKRLMQWWAINEMDNNVISYPQSAQAIKILEDNIFGVDIKDTATLVTIFGLTIALLDKLTPKEIWNNLKFSDLSQKNIQQGDFFTWSQQPDKSAGYFSLVIGNPPFNPIQGQSKKDVVSDEKLKIFNTSASKLPRNNFALKFFEGAKYWGQNVCMIIPSNVLLYDRRSLAYRKDLFTNYTVSKIFDFTHLRRDLFHKSADTPVVAVILENKKSLKQPIEHTVVKRMLTSERKIGFEIDYYDRHFVKWEWAIDEKKYFIWKANLLGGGRLFHLIFRLNLIDTLATYIKKKNKWRFNIGYIVGNSNQTNTASYITGKDYFLGMEKSGEMITQVETSNTFEAIRDEALFTPPYVLIKDVIGDECIPTYLIENYDKATLPFRRYFTGISAPAEDIDDLRKIHEYLTKQYADIYRFSVMVNSSSVLVKQETYLNKEDIEGLPFPEDESLLELSYTESILKDDVLNYYVHLGKAINENTAGSIFHQASSLNELNQFSDVFCNILNDRYATEGNTWQQGEILHKKNYYVLQFGFGKNEGIESAAFSKFEGVLGPIMDSEFDDNSRTYKRIFRLYQHINGFDCIFLIKPVAKRYWLKSIALRDADDTFIDLKREGY